MKLIKISGLIVVLLFSSCSKHKTNDGENEAQQYAAVMPSDEEIIAADEEESAVYDCLPLKEDTITVITSKGKRVRLSDIIEPNDLIARYSVLGCPDCISHVNEAIVRYKDSNPEKIVKVIISDSYVRDLHVYRNQFGKRFEFYLADSLPTDFDKTTPYLFFVGDSLQVLQHFIPRKEIPNRVIKYLGLTN